MIKFFLKLINFIKKLFSGKKPSKAPEIIEIVVKPTEIEIPQEVIAQEIIAVSEVELIEPETKAPLEEMVEVFLSDEIPLEVRRLRFQKRTDNVMKTVEIERR